MLSMPKGGGGVMSIDQSVGSNWGSRRVRGPAEASSKGVAFEDGVTTGINNGGGRATRTCQKYRKSGSGKKGKCPDGFKNKWRP